jgi:hypothetical protein
MLQLNFPSIQNVPRLPPTSFVSSSSNIPTVPLLRLNNHRRKGQFTEKIVKHGGPVRDSGLTAATKQKERQQKKYEKEFNTVDDIMNDFENDKEEIENMKQKIEINQKKIAKRVLKWFSAIAIQLKWRQYKAKIHLHRLRAQRFLNTLLRYKCYRWRRKRCAKALVNKVKGWLSHRHFINIMRRIRAAKKIQRQVRKRQSNIKLFEAISRLCITKRFIQHIFLFGERRAVKMIKDGPRHTWRIDIFKMFMAHCARKRRLRL